VLPQPACPEFRKKARVTVHTPAVIASEAKQ
jgi:hypothetical protein